MKKRKGLTLLEVILTLALIGIVLAIPINFLFFGTKVRDKSMSEADIQASTRLTSEYINNISRFATKVHTIPRSSFQHSEDGVRDPSTSYIGITKEGHIVIDKPGLNPGDSRIIEYIAKKQEGIDYEIIFDEVMYEKDNQEARLDRVLSFSIVGKKDGKIVTEIVSNIEVLNALNIDHLGTPSDPAVALAFSMVKPGSQEWIEVSPDAYITMVLDVSGSMDWDMDGPNITVVNRRIAILKENANKMIDRLANMDFDIYISLVPFSNHANNPKSFHNVNNENELALIKAEVVALSAYGATNTGDGVRRAYHQLKNKTDSLIAAGKDYSDFTQHMMVLVDGATNYESRVGNLWSIGPYFESNGNIQYNNPHWFIKGSYLRSRSNNDNDYVAYLGNNLIKNHTYIFEEEEKQIINTFVIGFSNRGEDHDSLNDIGEAINGKMFEHPDGRKPYIIATDAGELDFAFEQFESEVENSLWVITRPKLRP